MLSAKSSHNSRIYDEAAEWLVEFRADDVDAAGREKFNAWLRTSPTHLRAYLELAAIWQESPGLDASGAWRDADLLALASQEGDVIPLPARDRPAQPPQRSRRKFAVAIAATVLFSVSTLCAWLYLHGMYATGVGEQRSIALSDGSTIQLNSRSRVRVSYGKHLRSVKLIEGQALFRVAKDASRPFVVDSNDTQVRAVGTYFDVYRKAGRTIVTVAEGRVAVRGTKPSAVPAAQASAQSSEAPTRDEVFLSAGEQLSVETSKPMLAQPYAANVDAALAWTQRQLVFDNVPLHDVVEEFSRYNDRRIIIEGDQLDALEISGVFLSTDSTSLVNFLRARSDVKVVEGEDAVHIVSN